MTFNMHEQMDTAVNSIITKYIFEEITQESCDAIMDEIRRAFGSNAAAQVTLDTDDNSIEVKMRDILTNIRTYKVSAPKKTKEDINEV